MFNYVWCCFLVTSSILGQIPPVIPSFSSSLARQLQGFVGGRRQQVVQQATAGADETNVHLGGGQGWGPVSQLCRVMSLFLTQRSIQRSMKIRRLMKSIGIFQKKKHKKPMGLASSVCRLSHLRGFTFYVPFRWGWKKQYQWFVFGGWWAPIKIKA
jgi:hypothetical protein